MERSIVCCKSILKFVILEWFCVTPKEHELFYALV